MLPFGLAALYMLRIEAGLLLLDVDFDSSRFAWNDAHRSTPIELGWGWMFRTSRPTTARSSAARRSSARSPSKTSRWAMTRPRRRLAGLRPGLQRGRADPAQGPHADRRRTGCSTTTTYERVGYATSFMYSPMLQRHIAIARVRPDLAQARHQGATSSSPSTTTTSRSPRTSPGCRSTTRSERRPDMTTTAPKSSATADEPPRTAKPPRVDEAADRTYDAIVIGGGHNGLVNGAYLAKAGLKTLILERRHLVGGAAITEELRPGFWFTTFSYALSLLRPDIIHELELTKHGFMPLLMSSTLRARWRTATTCGSARTTTQNLKEIARHSQARRRRLRAVHATTWRWSARPSSRCSTWSRPTSSATIPRSCSRSPSLGSRFRELRQAGPAQRRPAADRQRRRLPRRLLRVGHPQGLPRVVEHHRHQGRAALAGLGPRAAVPLDRRARRRVRGVGLPQGRQRRVHPGARPGGAVVRRRDPPRVAGRPRHHQGRPGDRRRPRGRHRVPRRRSWSARSTRGARSSSWSTRASCPTDLVENIRRFRFQGTSSKVNFALDGLPDVPGARRSRRPVPRLHQHRPVDGLPRARLRRREVRLVQPAPVHRLRDPVDDRPRHGASGQARHVAASSSTRRTSCARATGTPSARTWATPCRRRSSRSSRASATSSSSARS